MLGLSAGTVARFVRLAILMVSTFGAFQNARLEAQVQARVQVSALGGGWYPWFQLAADPSNSNNLIVCGSRWDGRENAFYGFVYSSFDAGKTWQGSLEDKNSTWVTEQSCAFGLNGTAYFVSEASQVIDGSPHHNLGRTRIFVSKDAAHSWVETATTNWADYSVSVVDIEAGPNRNRLYTFFNYLPFNTGNATKDLSEGNGERVGLITYKVGDKRIGVPILHPGMGALRYKGAYPEAALLLKDGALLCLYHSVVETREGPVREFGAVRMDRTRKGISAPITIDRTTIRTGQPCYSYAEAYDSSHDWIYVAYDAFEGGECRLELANSKDGGRTWSKGEEIPPPETNGRHYYAPAMTFNRNGILGLLWRDNPSSDCWYFAASLDKGRRFTSPEYLSQSCNDRTATGPVHSDAFLRFGSSTSKLLGPGMSPTLHVGVVDDENRVWRNLNALTSTSDGVFHAVWIEAGNGEGQLRAAAVKFSAVQETSSEVSESKQLYDATSQVAVLYGGEKHYDFSSGALTLRVRLKNKSHQEIDGPLLIRVEKLTGELGHVEILNSENGLAGAGALWNLTNVIPGGALKPDEVTGPFSLVFRITTEKDLPSQAPDMVEMELKVLAGAICAAAPPADGSQSISGAPHR